jgi:hypothetical protein
MRSLGRALRVAILSLGLGAKLGESTAKQIDCGLLIESHNVTSRSLST